VVDQIKNYLPLDFKSTFIEIQKFNELHTDSFDQLVAIGGDGTVNSVAKRAKQEKKTLGIIPQGSGDGLARHFKIPKNIADATKIIVNQHTISIDTAIINDHFFINIAGIGFEAEVAHQFNLIPHRGLWGYIKLITKLFCYYQDSSLSMEIDHQKFNTSFFSLSIANGTQWGNNIKIASEADLQDGLLEIAILKKPKWYQIPYLIQQIISHKQVSNSIFLYKKGNKIRISAAKGNHMHIDGEPISVDYPIHIQVIPSSLKIIVPHE